MRFTLAALALSVAPGALFAQQQAQAQITHVTLYPQGAQVTRNVQIDAAEPTQIMIPGLPDGTDINQLRLSGDSVEVGAVSLIDDRLPVSVPAPSEAEVAARDEVERLRTTLEDKEDEVAAITARAEAAEDRIAYIKGLANVAADPEQGLAIMDELGARLLAAREDAVAARADARRADQALEADRDALKAARQALDALTEDAPATDTLVATVSGTGTLTITTFTDAAGWSPSYDLRLDRTAGQVRMDRFVSVHQASGEDWRDVDLTLSTARPGEQAAPPDLWPILRQAVAENQAPPRPMPLSEGATMLQMRGASMKTMSDQVLTPQMQGVTLTYEYGSSADIRNGVDALRLSLDHVDLAADVVAQAVPQLENTAYMVARMKNTSDQVLLPGQAALYVDGALVGHDMIPLTVAGADLDQGFGAIDGLQLDRIVTRNSGDRGVISKSNQQVEHVEITVKNSTGTDWPVRVLDQVPYSEQEDLKISYQAEPQVTEENVDDQQGILAWDLTVPAGDSQAISLDSTLSWPGDKVLR